MAARGKKPAERRGWLQDEAVLVVLGFSYDSFLHGLGGKIQVNLKKQMGGDEVLNPGEGHS